MKMRCFGCGVEKDTERKELYTEPGEVLSSDEPIDPLLVLCVQGPLLKSGERGYEEGQQYCAFKHTVVCHRCFSLLDPDMWISDACWERLGKSLHGEGKKLALSFDQLAGNHDEMCGTHDAAAFAALVTFPEPV